MKILHIALSRHFAGSEKVALSLAKAQAKAGHDARLAMRDGGNFATVAQKEGVPVIEPTLRKNWPNWGFLRAVAEFGPNVVHYHLTGAAKLAPRIQKRCAPGHVFHLHVNKRSAAYRVAAELGYLIAVSESAAGFYRAELGIPVERLEIVFNGVDSHHSDTAKRNKAEVQTEVRADLGLPVDARLLHVPGRIDPVKGQLDVIEAMPTILKSVPTAYALFSGSAANRGGYEQKLHERVTTLGLQDRVRFLGWRGDVDRLTRAADVQVIPSRKDPFPLVVLEAMALRTPLLTTAVDGIGEMAPSEAYALRFGVGDADTLAGKAISILQDADTAERLAEAAHQRLLNRYSIEAFTDSVMGVYEKALAARAG